MQEPEIDIVIEPYRGLWSKWKWSVYMKKEETLLLLVETSWIKIGAGFCRTREKAMERAKKRADYWIDKITQMERYPYRDLPVEGNR